MDKIPLTALHPVFARPTFRWKPLRAMLARVLSLPFGNGLLHKLFTNVSPADLRASFFVHAAREFGVRYEIEGVNNIPNAGPLIVVANHPKGMPEGLALGAILQEIRSDAKLVANGKLTQVPHIDRAVIPVDLTAPGGNAGAVRGMLQQLKAGGAIGIFPAGAIATFSLRDRKVRDDRWSETATALAEKTGATIVPIHFSGNNSWLFHTVTAFGRHLRGLLYFHEFARDRCHKTILTARVGKPVPAGVLGSFPDRAAATAELRRLAAA